jgi:protein-disulfide isomerase
MAEAKKKKSCKFVRDFKKNPWKYFSVFFATVLLIVSILFLISSGAFISGKSVGENFVKFINSQGGSQIELVSVEKLGADLYELKVSVQDQEVVAHVTKDGKYFVQLITPIDDSVVSEVPEEETPTEIPKSDKPKVELFIWSYCPYGVTALSPLADVAKLLGSYADFDVVLYYAGHGDFELQQNKIQACIQELDKEKYWDYAQGFVEEIYPVCSGDITCDKDKSVELMDSLGIDSNEVLSCVEESGETLVEEDYNRARELGVTGSPTLVVNDVVASVSRTSESFKGAVCSAFNNVPEECGQALDNQGSSASGSC